MYTNEAGLKVLESGDVVTRGRGKTEYRVFGYSANDYSAVVLMSRSTGKRHTVSEGDLNLVTNIRDTEEWKSQNQTPAEEPVEETSAYAKAVLFALNKFQKHVYAGTVSKTKKAKTRKLNRRQKASRKANR